MEIEAIVLERVRELGHDLAQAKDVQAIAKIKLQISEKQDSVTQLFLQTVQEYCQAEIDFMQSQLGTVFPVIAYGTKTSMTLAPEIVKVMTDTVTRKLKRLQMQIKADDFSWAGAWDQILDADRQLVELYAGQFGQLKAHHGKLTLAWAMADSAMQEHLRPELDRIKAEMDQIAPKPSRCPPGPTASLKSGMAS